jgi:hypothetical protein
MKNNREELLPFLVRENGRYDLQASLSKFKDMASKYIASQEAEENLVVECLHQLFDEHKGAGLNVKYIIAHIIPLMQLQVASLKDTSVYPMLQKRVAQVLKDQTEAGTFVATKGPHACHRRVADIE